MTAKPRRPMSPMSVWIETRLVAAIFALNELFRRRPRPCSLPLVSGIAPSANPSGRPLSETQLRQIEAWLQLHQEGWFRNYIPAGTPSYMVQLDHSDGTTTLLSFFSRMRSSVYFENFGAGRRDAAWLHHPVTEVEALIALLKVEA